MEVGGGPTANTGSGSGVGGGGTIWKYNSTVEEVHQWWLEQLNINTDDDSDEN